ncbi:MAG: hypothetical protein BWY05_00291 [Euryarchaeota archaeon ADurb.Bin165]|jgi:hypothetical protein|nr:MAG: hypothetical protein BWY05_00291 [Euryarchaeota archaeon ADurb.Bin165]
MKRINLLKPFGMNPVFKKMAKIWRNFAKQKKDIASRSRMPVSKPETIDISMKTDNYRILLHE